MNPPPRIRPIRAAVLAASILSAAATSRATITLNTFFGPLTDSTGAPAPDGALWIMVHDENSDGRFPGGLAADGSLADPAAAHAAFAGRTLAVDTMVEGDRIFALGPVDSTSAPAGATSNTVAGIDPAAHHLVAGRKWALYWFPGLAPGSTTVPADRFDVGGINEVSEVQPGSDGPMTIPADGSIVTIAVYDSGLGGTLPPARFRALTATSGSFAAWIDRFFPGQSDPDITGFGADPDRDGLDNGVECVLGTRPDQRSPGLTQPEPGAEGLRFTTTLAKGTPAGVDATWQWSTDLAGWQPDGATAGPLRVAFSHTVVDSSHPEHNLVEVTAKITGAPAPRLFVRLSARLAP